MWRVAKKKWKNYCDYCIQSFNKRILNKYKKNLSSDMAPLHMDVFINIQFEFKVGVIIIFIIFFVVVYDDLRFWQFMIILFDLNCAFCWSHFFLFLIYNVVNKFALDSTHLVVNINEIQLKFLVQKVLIFRLCTVSATTYAL